LIGRFSQHESPHVIGDSADSQGLATTNVRSFPLSGKRVVKDWPALICADTIRSLRTKWSRMANKAVVRVFLLQEASRAALAKRNPPTSSLGMADYAFG
jgi:hypothetical protein